MIPTFENFSIANLGMHRRTFIKGVGATGALVLTANWSWAQDAEEPRKYGGEAMPGGLIDDPKVFIALQKDGTVDIIVARAEMGQGIKSSLALVIADEMEAEWSRCRVSLAPGDQLKFGNQNTDGSRSMRHWFKPLRRCGATARAMLEQAAADTWQVPVSDVSALQHSVVHPASGRVLGYGDLAARMAEMDVPDPATVTFKDAGELRYIGKEHSLSCDSADMASGRAVYGSDVRFEGMLTAVISRPPVLDSKAVSWDDTEALKVPGVVKVVEVKGYPMPSAFNPLGGVAVVAENTWAALRGREALKVEWSASEHDTYESGAYRAAMEEAAKNPGKLLREEGDLEKAFADAHSKVEASYYAPHISHAPMEPPAAVAVLKDGFLETWAPVQDPGGARGVVAAHVGMDPANTRLNQTLLGGAFGRKAFSDFACEAAELATMFPGQAVCVQWTREDDLRHDYLHTVSVEHLEGSLDAKGNATGWLHRSVAPSIFSLFMPDPMHQFVVESNLGHLNMPFAIPNLRLENPSAKTHTRIGWFRSVSNVPHAFAAQSFICELAHAAGKNHLEFYLGLLGGDRKINPADIGDTWNYDEDPELYPVDTARLRGVAEKAAAEAGWGKKLPRGRGMGLAVHYSFVTYVAVVLEVEVSERGELTVHKANVAVDCGKAVNPDRVRSQMEGSCVMGIGIAASNEISFRDGAVVQSNFHDYVIPRMPLAPKSIAVHIVDPGRDVPLGGCGEPGIPPVAPALCNAIFAATGKRIRSLPIGSQLA